MSLLPTLASLSQPHVDSRWLWVTRILTLIFTLLLVGVVIWSLFDSAASWESAFFVVPYLAALGWALWSMRVNPPGKFGVALVAGFGLVVSLILVMMAIAISYPYIENWKQYRVPEPIWLPLAGVEALLSITAGLCWRRAGRNENAKGLLWAVRILAMAGVALPILAFNTYFQQMRRFDTWLAPLERVLVLLGALLIALIVLWFLRSQSVAGGTEGRRALILILISSPVMLVVFFLWSVSTIYYAGSAYDEASTPSDLLWWLPALLASGYTISATKVFFLLKRERGDAWRLVGAFFLAVAVVVTSATLLMNGHRGDSTHASTVGSLRTIYTAEITYASTYSGSYSLSLAELGPPPAGAPATASAAGLIDEVLARGTKNRYRFNYTPGVRTAKGAIASFTLNARPLEYTNQTRLSYFTDETGVIRSTQEDRSATAQDSPLQ